MRLGWGVLSNPFGSMELRVKLLNSSKGARIRLKVSVSLRYHYPHISLNTKAIAESTALSPTRDLSGRSGWDIVD